MTECAKIVEGNIVSFACDLDMGHPGPCRAKENPRSVRERARWEEEQRIEAGEGSDAQRTLAEFQGPAQTTAERYTTNASPVPKTREEIIAEQYAPTPEPPVAVQESQIEQDWIEQQASEEDDENAWRDEFGVASDFYGEVYYDEEDDSFYRISDDDDGEAPEEPQPMSRDEFLASQAPTPAPQPEVAPPAPTASTSLTDGNVADVLARVEGDLTLVNQALEEEEGSESPRSTLVAGLEKEARRIRRETKKAQKANQATPTHANQAAPTKTRPGDQPLPTPREALSSVQDRILVKAQALLANGGLTDEEYATIEQSMQKSIEVGIQRYGTPLQTFNGRDTLQDAIDEARDLFVYLNAMQQAREEEREVLVEIVSDAIIKANEQRQGDNRTSFGVGEIATVAVDAILNSTGPLVAQP